MNYSLIIAGSRSLDDIRLIRTHMIDVPFIPLEIITGDAIGIDKNGNDYAKEIGLEPHTIKPQYNLYGPKRAPYFRNLKMAKKASSDNMGALLAIWDGSSNGTRSMIDIAKPMYPVYFKYIKIVDLKKKMIEILYYNGVESKVSKTYFN